MACQHHHKCSPVMFAALLVITSAFVTFGQGREVYAKRFEILDLMNLKPGMNVAEIKKALRPDGLFLLIDAERTTGLTSEGRMEMVRSGKGTFTDEMINAGFKLEEEIDLFELDYVLKFRHRQIQETSDTM